MNRKRLVLALLPLVVLAGLLTIFAVSLNRDPSIVPSVLINKPAPQFTLPAVAGLGVPGFDTKTLQGHVSVVNVFASWCVPCRAEHPNLEKLKADTNIPLYGINQKDKPENATAFLRELGNPYDAVGSDADGRVSIDWGIYGVPETFVVNAKGIITYKYIGPMDENAIETALKPAIVKAAEE